MFFEPLAKTFLSIPMAIVKRVLANYQSGDMYLIRFIICTKMVDDFIFRDSVITDKGKGYDQYLTFVGGVSQAFRIAIHSCVEDSLSGGRTVVAEGETLPF